MKEIAEWLIRIENISNRFYLDAAVHFKDSDLAPFLERCANDEARHAQLIHAALNILADHPEIKSSFKIDLQVKDRIEAPFLECRRLLDAQTLSHNQLIDCMVATEFSEWNHIFVYLVNAIKSIAPEFASAAAELQGHLRHVTRFIGSSAYGREKLEKLKALEPVWQERILIIEDDPQLAELFASVLEPEGRVDVAPDGHAGMDLIELRYYRLIVSDVNMPGLDGIALYRKAADRFPGIGRRYLFLTGNPSREVAAFFEFNGLRYLTKPASIRDIQTYAAAILNEPPVHRTMGG